MINKIGIVGLGFVGNAIYQNVKKKYDTKVYDLDPSKNIDGYLATIKSDIVFVCLPTPMTSAEGGKCNISILKKFFIDVPVSGCDGIFVIKSTIPIGTTKKLQEVRPDLKIAHNPEFLTAANAVQDFANTERNVIGCLEKYTKTIEEFYKNITPNAKNIFVTSEESEAIKYFSNTFLATKVAYFNYIYDLSQKLNLDYKAIVSGITADSRIGDSHTKIPGPDGDRGFGGTCFPKDINALIYTLKELELETSILEEVWNYNKKIRKNWDWAVNKSAVNDE